MLVFYEAFALWPGAALGLVALLGAVIVQSLGHGLNNERVLLHVWLGTALIMLGLHRHCWGDSAPRKG